MWLIMKKRKLDINIGDIIGRLTIDDVFTMGHGRKTRLYFKCHCSCGTRDHIVRADILRSGQSLSCGCWNTDSHKTHGLSKTRLHNIWSSMHDRCYGVNHSGYKRYGARGIGICDEWRNDFVKFKEDALRLGYSDDLTIERIDINRGYFPDNVKFIPLSEQSKNTSKVIRITYLGETKILTDWARQFGIHPSTFHRWIKSGMTMEESFIRARNLKKDDFSLLSLYPSNLLLKKI